MRVAIIVDHPFEAPLGYSIRPKQLSVHLAKLGCEVHVLSPIDVRYKFSNNLILHGISSHKAIFMKRLHRLLRKTYKNSVFARYLYRRRVLNRLAKQLADSLYLKVKNCGAEVLQGEKEIAAMAAVILGKRLGIPVVADIHGLLAEEAVQYGFIESGGREYFESIAFVSEVLCESDAVVVVSESLKDYLVKSSGIDDRKIFTVPNAGTFRGIIRSSKAMPRNIVYAGILEPWERVELAIKSMLYVTKVKREARLLIAGTGSIEKDLVKLVNRLKLNDYVSFIGTIPYEKVAGFLAQGDVAVLPSTTDIVRKVACPIKLFDYLAIGLPVVTINGLWWSDFVRLHGVGLASDDEPKSFANAINELLSSPDKISVMSKNAVKLVKQQYNWREMAKKMLEVYEKL